MSTGAGGSGSGDRGGAWIAFSGAILAAIIGGIFLLISSNRGNTVSPPIAPPTVPVIAQVGSAGSNEPSGQYEAPATNTPKLPQLPTHTPIIPPTDTPIIYPTDTPLGDTDPQAILELGDTWHTKGLELTLTDHGFTNAVPPGAAVVTIYLVNRRTQPVSIRVSSGNFSAVDNNGHRLQLSTTDSYYSWNSVYKAPIREQNWLISPGGGLGYSDGTNDAFLVVFDVTDPSITNVIFTASNISSITKARWNIPAPTH